MDDQKRDSLSNRDSWARLPVMLLFFLLLAIAAPLLAVVSLAGWVMRLINGRQPEGVVEFGQTLADWFACTARYLTGGAERRPFPFEDLDCPSDHPPAARSTSGEKSVGQPGKAAEAPVSEAVSAVREKADNTSSERKAANQVAAKPEADDKPAAADKTAARKQSAPKSGQKKAGAKKTTNKKTANKKTASKKTGSKKTASKKTASKKRKSTRSAADQDDTGSANQTTSGGDRGQSGG